MGYKCKKCKNVYDEQPKLCGYCAKTDFELTDEVEPKPCPECGGLRGGHGNRRCSLMTLKYAQEEIINVEQRWLKWISERMSINQKNYAQFKKEIGFLQGKISILKHENNKLREKFNVKTKVEK